MNISKSPVLLLLLWSCCALLSAGERADGSQSPIRFQEIGEESRTRHIHHTRSFQGPHGEVLGMFTAGGAAAAVADFDNDGLEDIYVTDSEEGHRGRLFRNQGDLQFADVTLLSELGGGNDAESIVSDALWFDYDNDGWQDLLLVRFGTPLLFRNQTDGTFADISAGTGFNRFGNSIGAIAFDYDRDGLLDLLFADYFPPFNLLHLKEKRVLPTNLDNADNGGGVQLWQNQGGGRFQDVTARAGLEQNGWALDVGHGDLDQDGWPDLYVACDFGTDRIFMNNGDGTFADVTEEAIGFDTKKGMNAEIADYNNDGLLDIYVTNITDEYMKECNMLWHNNGDGTFIDLSQETATCNTLWGWGAQFGDFDNDGWQDLFAVNGLRSAGEGNYIPVLVEMIITPGVDFANVENWPDIGDMTWSGYQESKLFRNLGQLEIFEEISGAAGVDNDLDGRGVALADFDLDGRLDIYQTNADQPSLLYRNISPPSKNWIQFDLVGTTSNRDAIGARIELWTDDFRQVREVKGGNGYSAQSSKRIHFGLGSAESADRLTILWPSGTRQTLTDLPANRLHEVREEETNSSGPEDPGEQE